MEKIKEMELRINRTLTVMAAAGLMITAVFVSVAGATTYYVDDGRPDDTGSGLSWATAFKHIQKAADIVVAGDTVEVKAGIYDDGFKEGGYGTVGSVPAYPYPVIDDMYPLRARVLISGKTGTYSEPITFHANGDVIVDGASPDIDIDACFYVYNSEYIVIDGFTCRNAISKNTSSIIPDHFGYGNGILLDMSSYCTIINNNCYGNNGNGICLGRVAGKSDNTIKFSHSRGSCNFNYVIKNICHDNGSSDSVGSWAAGILVFGGASGGVDDFGYYGPYVQSNSNFVAYNYCYQNFSKGLGIIGSGDWGYVKYNILANNWQSGGHEGAGIVFHKLIYKWRLYIEFNTIVDHLSGPNASAGIFISDTWEPNGGNHVWILNNIIANNSYGVRLGSGLFNARGANNDLYNTVTNFLNCKVGYEAGGQYFNDAYYYAPLFYNGIGSSWADSYILKAKYQPDKDVNGDTLPGNDATMTSPCVDRYNGEWDLGAHWRGDSWTVSVSTGYITMSGIGGQVGYPDKPFNLGGYVDGTTWYSTKYAILSFDLRDPVVPPSAEMVKYNYQIKYESNDFSAPDFDVNDPFINWQDPGFVSVSTDCALNYEGQYNWRVRCRDAISGGSYFNYSTYTVANNGNIAFGLDWTQPPAVSLSAVVFTSTATLSWTGIVDSPATDKPITPPVAPYERESGLDHYIVYRSTFNLVDEGYTEDAWKAQVAFLGGIIANNVSAGATSFNDPGPLTVGKTYYYAVIGVDRAGNEADFNLATGGASLGSAAKLIYISGDHPIIMYQQSFSGDVNAANTAPCYGDDSGVPPNSSTINLAVSNGTVCNLAYNDYSLYPTYHIGNEHWVRHYARIETRAGTNPPGVRFYYTVGTSQVLTNVDSSTNANYFINGTEYTPVSGAIAGYTYFYADIPSDIHAAGDNPWNASQPWGVVGVKISGHPKYDTNRQWTNEDSSPFGGYTYTYYVRRSDPPDYEFAYPGEKKQNVRKYPLKHVSDMLNNLLTKNPSSVLRYVMPGGDAPVNNKGYSGGCTTNVADTYPDIFYGEKPDLYVRLAYSDGDKGSSYVVFGSSTTAYDSGWINDNAMAIASTITLSGIDNDADDSSVTGGFGTLTNPFYGHFSFMKTPDATKLANIGTQVPPEGADVMYYFKIHDGGSDIKFRYAADVTTDETKARANPYRYYVLQNDYSRPYIQTTTGDDANGLQPQDVKDLDDSSWMTFYTVTANLWDRSDGLNAPSPAVYGNVINDRGNDSGVYRNPVDPGVGSSGDPVHDTRVYYKISATLATGINADKYLTPSTTPDYNYISDDAPEGGGSPDLYDVNDSDNDGCGYVQMSGTLNGGLWTGQIPLRAGDIGKNIYYRIYVCNDDRNPQAYNWHSRNFIDGTGVANVGQTPTGTGAAFSNPYDSTSCETDRDHGWAMYTRYGGKITGPKLIKVRARVNIQGITKNVVAYINAEGETVGNIIYSEMEKNQ